MGLPRLFILDDERKHAMTTAELSFVKGLADELREKRLT